MVASASLFEILGVQAVVGRVYGTDDDVQDGRKIVISHGMWTTYFGNDPSVVGKTVLLNDNPHEVVGVMPRGFGFPDRNVMIWAPLGLARESSARQSHSLSAIARMKAGVEIEDVRSELAVLMDNWREEFPDIHTGHFLIVEPLIDSYVRNVRAAMWLVFGAVGLLLLIACLNITGVLLARSESRLREFVVRYALGAGRVRLFRQLLVEYAVLAAAGGGAGVAIAYVAVPILMGLEGNGIPRIDEVVVDPIVLGFSILITVAALAVFGVVPAWQTSRPNAGDVLREGGRHTASAARLVFRRLMIAGEIALAVVIASGAGLMLRSVDRLRSVDTGVESSGRVVARISLPSSRYREPQVALNFYANLLERLRADPRVISATAASYIPYAATPGVWDFQINGMQENHVNGVRLNGHIDFVHDDFFETMGVRLVLGRYFTEADVAGSEMATIISEAMARTFFPDQDPIGRQVSIDGPDNMGTIVGVVDDVHWQGMRQNALPTRYFLQAQSAEFVPFMTRNLQVALHTAVAPLSLVPTLKSVVNELDADLPVRDIQTVDDAVSGWLAQDRFFSLLMSLFAVIAVILGSVGIYGVMSYSVAQRTREIGLRVALGASRSRIAGSVVAQSLVVTAGGVLAGVAVTVASARVLTSVLYNLSPRDPATLFSVAALFAVVGVGSALVPTWRALRVNPAEVLKSE